MKRHGVVTPPEKTTSNGIQKSNLQTRGDKQRSPDIHVGEKVTTDGFVFKCQLHKKSTMYVSSQAFFRIFYTSLLLCNKKIIDL